MSQAPTQETIGDFYSAVFLHKVSVVVCLTPLVESGRVKATRYWPTVKEESVTLSLWKVTLQEEKVMYDGAIVRRTLRIQRREPVCNALGACDASENELTFTMFHYMTWCDNASPSSVHTFVELINLVRAIADLDRSRPVLAHCSAGVGRAGTFVAAYNLILINEMDSGSVTLKQMVDWLRHQRFGAVQTLAQYKFISHVVNIFDDISSSASSSSSDSLSTSTFSDAETLSSSADSDLVLNEELLLRTCQYGCLISSVRVQ